ncbi:DUF2787 domain-containing protein [Photobacterium rosenbergii]|uniref:DUF2787 domain-containing protein n=1 Tax=Photobacterium rosenbergii TaxID=294936 RepID=A0ABU3ZLI7_9GAMM|nr:DUF2787 domain-containing protein [Photobacterium rosenbergii]MDV5170987.1 DUF2787 domain-containing protein [Photobacterium rosenbergii]
MKLYIDKDGLCRPASARLIEALNQTLGEKTYLPSNSMAIVFNFRDVTYSADRGGFHPVEIRLSRLLNEWLIDYITDFSYQGYPQPELAKEVDFDFSTRQAMVAGLGAAPFDEPDVLDFYQLWESNFLTYLDEGCFTEIEVEVA